MQRTIAVPAADAPAPPVAAAVESFQTVFAFTLPRGYVDAQGVVHRDGSMRLATARDEITPLRDPRVQQNEAFLTVLLLSRVVVELGTVTAVDADVIEDLFSVDLAFLQDLYRRINQEGHTHATVQCPTCESEFSVDVAGAPPGGS